MPENKSAELDLAQFVVFEIDREEYAVRLTDLKEIIKIPELTPLPNAAPFFSGVFNLRGKIIPVIDLEKRFHLKRERPPVSEHILITELGQDLYGMMVDKVSGTIRLPEAAIQKPQSIGVASIDEQYIEGIAAVTEAAKPFSSSSPDSARDKQSKQDKKQKKRLIIILKINKVLSPEELIELARQAEEGSRKAALS